MGDRLKRVILHSFLFIVNVTIGYAVQGQTAFLLLHPWPGRGRIGELPQSGHPWPLVRQSFTLPNASVQDFTKSVLGSGSRTMTEAMTK
jgi:hypothetical protein